MKTVQNIPVAALASAAFLTAVLSGCAQEQGPSAGPPTSSPSASPVVGSPLPTPSPTLTPSADPIAEPAATCETVFTDDEYAALEADGLVLQGDADHASADSHLSEGRGGISCLWLRSQSDVMAWYAQWSSDEEGWNSLKAELLGKGYTEISDPFAGILQSPPDPNYTPGIMYRDGTIYHVSTPQLLRSVLTLQ